MLEPDCKPFVDLRTVTFETSRSLGGDFKDSFGELSFLAFAVSALALRAGEREYTGRI